MKLFCSLIINELSPEELNAIIERLNRASKSLHLLWSTTLDELIELSHNPNKMKSFEIKGELFTLLDKNIKKLNDIKYKCIKSAALKQKRKNDEISDQKSNEG